MKIRKYIYAALLAASALSFAPSHAVAEAPARGKFKLAHDVYWGNTPVSAGEYEFSYDPYQTSPILTLTKLSGERGSLMVLVTDAEGSKPSDSNLLLLETVGDGSYVSVMELAECGITLHFTVPSHPVKQMAKAVSPVASPGQ